MIYTSRQKQPENEAWFIGVIYKDQWLIYEPMKHCWFKDQNEIEEFVVWMQSREYLGDAAVCESRSKKVVVLKKESLKYEYTSQERQGSQGWTLQQGSLSSPA